MGEKMTGLADLILSRSGNMEIYDETFEKITFYLNQKDQEKASVGVASGAKEENLLDMFAKDLDEDEDEEEPSSEAQSKPKSNNEIPMDISNEISWQFRWENTADSEIH